MKSSLFLLAATNVFGSAINSYKKLAVPSLAIPVSICDKDESVEAICAIESEPIAYQKSKAVLRISRSGMPHCTGWLVGDQGHVITNNHCASTSSAGKSLKFEAMAQGSTCETDCKRSLACKGTQIHKTQLDFVATGGNTDLDWTLFKLTPPELDT